MNCTAGSDGAPADLVTELTAIEDRSRAMVGAVSILLTLAGTLTRAGYLGAPGSIVETAFEDRFGVPPAVKGGFMNRLTGSVQPTLDEARGQEMELMARRYELIANAFDGPLHYRCISGASSFGGATSQTVPTTPGLAQGLTLFSSAPGSGLWPPGTQSTLLIHETSHMIWEHVIHGAGGREAISVTLSATPASWPTSLASRLVCPPAPSPRGPYERTNPDSAKP